MSTATANVKMTAEAKKWLSDTVRDLRQNLLKDLADAVESTYRLSIPAERAGLDIESVVEVISKGAAGSWQMENRHKTMAKNEFEFGFAVDWMRKDLDICLEEATKNGALLPMTEVVNGYYKEVQAMGGRRWDTSSLIARLRAL